MSEYILQVPGNKQGKALLNFLKQIEFVHIDKFSRLNIMEDEIKVSMNDLKAGRVSSWKGKKVSLKNA